MPRPKIYGDLVTTSITIESETLARAKSMGLNISQIVRQALDTETSNPENLILHDKFKDIPAVYKQKIRKFVTQDTSKAEYWAKWANKKFNKNITKEDIIHFVSKK